MRTIAIALISVALAAAGCKKKEDKGGTPEAVAKPPATSIDDKKRAAEPKGIVKDSYPDHVDGLRDLMADLVRAHRRDVADARARAAEVLALPAAADWFAKRFGAEVGKHLAHEYQVYGHGFEEFPRLVTEQGEKHGRKQFVVERISSPADPKAFGFQARALEAMTEAVPLYTFRLRGEGKADFILYSFVHDGVTFRYVGRMARFDGKLPKDRVTLEKPVGETAAKK